MDSFKTSQREFQKKAKVTGDLISNKITDVVAKLYSKDKITAKIALSTQEYRTILTERTIKNFTWITKTNIYITWKKDNQLLIKVD